MRAPKEVLHKLQFSVELLHGGVCGAVPNTLLEPSRKLQNSIASLVRLPPPVKEFFYMLSFITNSNKTNGRFIYYNAQIAVEKPLCVSAFQANYRYLN